MERAVKSAMEVRQQLSSNILDTVPKTILLGPVQGLSVALEQGLAGEPMSFGPIPWTVTRWHRQNWRAWRLWLTEFQRQTAIDSLLVTAGLLDDIAAHALSRTLGRDPSASHILDDLVEVTKGLEGFVIPRAWRYGDAHHSNILLHRGKVSGVVDWEGAENAQWVSTDWFQFAFQYLVDLHRVQCPQVSSDVLGKKAADTLLNPPQCSLDSLIQEQTSTFMDTWGMTAEAMPALFVAFVAKLYWPSDKKNLLKHVHALLCR